MKQFRRIFLFMLIVSGCTSDEEPVIDIGKTFIPLNAGDFHIYNIDEITYSPLEDPVELHYQVKTEVVDSFEDNGGSVTYVVHRSRRESENDTWAYVDSWSVRVTDFEAIVNEGNVSYVKIAFPITVGKKWNGNTYNASEADEYEITSVNESYSIGDKLFKKTIVVDQENRVDLLFNERRFEVYAKEIGLIYREVTDINYCDEVECFGQNKIVSGIIYRQTMVEYGPK